MRQRTRQGCFVLGLIGLVMGCSACGGSAKAASSSSAARKAATNTSTTDRVATTTTTSVPQGDVIVICSGSDSQTGVTLSGYNSQTLQKVFSETLPGGDLGSSPCTEGAYFDWNSSFTLLVLDGPVSNNGRLPEVRNFSDPNDPVTTDIGVTESTTGFNSISNNAQCASFDANGNVWWTNQTSSSSDIQVMENTNVVATLSSSVNLTLPLYGGESCNFEFNGTEWEIFTENFSAAYPTPSYINSAGSVSPTDFFNQPPEIMPLANVEKLLPETQESPHDGFYSSNRETIYFLAVSPTNVTNLYSVPAAGGEPTIIASDLAGTYSSAMILGVETAGVYSHP